MKKIFTLALALMGFAGVANAANVDDLAVLKHSYVLVCDNLGARPGKGVLFGDNHFLDVNGGTTATNKGKVDLSQPGPTTYDDGKYIYIEGDYKLSIKISGKMVIIEEEGEYPYDDHNVTFAGKYISSPLLPLT